MNREQHASCGETPYEYRDKEENDKTNQPSKAKGCDSIVASRSQARQWIVF